MIAADHLTEIAGIFGDLAVTPNGIAQREQLERLQQAFSRMATDARTQSLSVFSNAAGRDEAIPLPTLWQTVLILSSNTIETWDGATWIIL